MSTAASCASAVAASKVAECAELELPDAAAIASLAASLSSRALVLLPSSPLYESYRLAWNYGHSAQPPLILVAACTADVSRVVRWCRLHSLPMTVASGRHSRHSISAQAVQLNLEHMRAVQLSLSRMTITAQGGARNGDIDAETSHHHLGTTLGSVASTGMGLALGGGNGYLSRRRGFTCDNAVSAQLVTAEGDVVECDESSNAELLWGIRGAGANLGVVTSLTLRVYPVGHRLKKLSVEDEETAAAYSLPPQELLEGRLVMLTKVYPAAAAVLGLVALSSVSHGSAAVSQDLFFETELVSTPNGPCFVVVCGYHGADIYAGHRLAAELSDRITAGFPDELPLLMRECKTLSYLQLQAWVGGLAPPGHWLERSVVLDVITPELAAIIHAQFLSRPGSIMPCIAWNARGRAQEVEPSSSSLSPATRASSFWLLLLTPYAGPGQEAEALAWQLGVKAALDPYKSASVANTMQDTSAAVDVYASHLHRLQQLKTDWDSTNFFHFNNNIAPKSAA